MIKMSCICILSGLAWNPDLLLLPEQIEVLHKYKIGDIIARGRYKGKKSEEGQLAISGQVDIMLDLLLSIKRKELWKLFNYINVNFNIEFEGQCNFELSNPQINKISELGIELGITCYEKT